jgi:hypothetical protein
MLGPPASFSGKSAGLVSLGSVPDLLGAYQAGGHFARRKSAEEHRESLVKYLAAYIESQRWIMDPANKKRVMEVMIEEYKLAPEVDSWHLRTQHDPSPAGKKADVLLRRLRGRVFTGRRHNSLEPQIGDHVPIVLIRVRRIDRKQGELRQVEVHEFHHLAALCIGHAVERLIAVCNRVLQRSHEISFRGFCFLDSFTWICFASGLRAKRVGSVSHMANELAKTANVRCRFEGVVFFRHFLRRTNCRVAYKRVEPSFARRNRICWRSRRRLRLLLSEESNGNRRQCSKHKTESFGHETPPGHHATFWNRLGTENVLRRSSFC